MVWINDKKHSLGEMDWKDSKKLVAKLLALGCVKVHACEIDSIAGGFENTGHVVVELPKQKSKRTAILKKIHSLAEEQGYGGCFDNGQHFAYVKLD